MNECSDMYKSGTYINQDLPWRKGMYKVCMAIINIDG